jgi:hypothetical protein
MHQMRRVFLNKSESETNEAIALKLSSILANLPDKAVSVINDQHAYAVAQYQFTYDIIKKKSFADFTQRSYEFANVIVDVLGLVEDQLPLAVMTNTVKMAYDGISERLSVDGQMATSQRMDRLPAATQAPALAELPRPAADLLSTPPASYSNVDPVAPTASPNPVYVPAASATAGPAAKPVSPPVPEPSALQSLPPELLRWDFERTHTAPVADLLPSYKQFDQYGSESEHEARELKKSFNQDTTLSNEPFHTTKIDPLRDKERVLSWINDIRRIKIYKCLNNASLAIYFIEATLAPNCKFRAEFQVLLAQPAVRRASANLKFSWIFEILTSFFQQDPQYQEAAKLLLYNTPKVPGESFRSYLLALEANYRRSLYHDPSESEVDAQVMAIFGIKISPDDRAALTNAHGSSGQNSLYKLLSRLKDKDVLIPNYASSPGLFGAISGTGTTASPNSSRPQSPGKRFYHETDGASDAYLTDSGKRRRADILLHGPYEVCQIGPLSCNQCKDYFEEALRPRAPTCSRCLIDGHYASQCMKRIAWPTFRRPCCGKFERPGNKRKESHEKTTNGLTCKKAASMNSSHCGRCHLRGPYAQVWPGNPPGPSPPDRQNSANKP